MIWHLVYWWWSCHHLVIYQYRVDITFKQEIKANLGHDNSSQLKTVTFSLHNQRNKFKVFAISMQSSALHAACLPAAVVCCTRLPWCGARHRLSVSCPGRQPLLTRSCPGTSLSQATLPSVGGIFSQDGTWDMRWAWTQSNVLISLLGSGWLSAHLDK